MVIIFMKKTIKKRIIELLTIKELTALEISSELLIQKDNLASYLSILKKEKKIITINDKKPYKYRANTPLRYLKDLYDLMNDKMNFEKTPDTNDVELIKKIELVMK